MTAKVPKRPRTIASGTAITMPGGGDVHLFATPPKPCVTIVVHGVNDLAGCYERIERGLCQGLNERLGMEPEVSTRRGVRNPGYLEPAPRRRWQSDQPRRYVLSPQVQCLQQRRHYPQCRHPILLGVS